MTGVGPEPGLGYGRDLGLDLGQGRNWKQGSSLGQGRKRAGSEPRDKAEMGTGPDLGSVH